MQLTNCMLMLDLRVIIHGVYLKYNISNHSNQVNVQIQTLH